jgi:phenylalanine-4-hydroxylase
LPSLFAAGILVVMETSLASHAGGADDLVVLDPDHPGFRDPVYRERRNGIARLALEYQDGEPVPEVEYTRDEHDVWRTVWQHLEPLHEAYACREYLACSRVVELSRTRIPQLSDVNRVLEARTGMRMLPVAGLVSARTFLSYLGRRVFLSTQYIRHQSRPLYTPEPDVVHELIGHAATFVHPGLTELNELFGSVTAESDEATVERIARVYWYTLEFGAVEEAGGVKAFGAGLLSSAGELERLSEGARLMPFDPGTAAATPYDPTSYQPGYFVAESFDGLVAGVGSWLQDLEKARA